VSDAYIEAVLASHVYVPHPLSDLILRVIESGINEWSNGNLRHISFVGSVPKGTAIEGTTDLDLFISLESDTPHTLKEIYEKLSLKATALSWGPRKQNCSIGINFLTMKIDLVPGRLQPSFTYYHWIWKRKQETWQQTAPELHVRDVGESGRTKEIRAIKIWRKLHNLEFPSFYLEMAVIEALRGRRDNLAQNVHHVLGYIADNLVTARIEDPANSANDISDDLTAAEKRVVATQAGVSFRQRRWEDIIW
jgi:hypothetical protein